MMATTNITVLPERRKEFFQSMGPLIQQVRQERGCLTYRLYEEMGDENSLVVVEEWRTADDWQMHRNGDNFSVIFGLLGVLSVPSKIDFRLLEQVGGNDLIRNS